MKAMDINFDIIGKELNEPQTSSLINIRQENRRLAKLSMNEGS
jgi:hypothetical protein